MPSFTRKYNWKARVLIIKIFVLLSVGFLVFLNVELFHKHVSDGYPSRRKYIAKKTVLRKQRSPVGDYSSLSQFQDIAKYGNPKVTPCNNWKDCFNFEKCDRDFKIYVYPFGGDIIISSSYKKFLDVMKSSVYSTDDPGEACLYMLALDTLDRDPLSVNMIKDLDSKIALLENWNNGENHIIFVHFSGTWPLYTDELYFNYGKAIIVKSSFSISGVRQGYDVSIPLLPKDFVIATETNLNYFDENTFKVKEKFIDFFPLKKRYLLGFKGKRYLHGIGSETRNSLRTINNDQDIILVTTCKHGNNWEAMKDKDCDQDNAKFDSYDYDDLLSNSTFCLVPRGRRLASFRFLEAMQHTCIPVILSNGWHLPFSEVIDWSKFSIMIDERRLMQVPSILQSITDDIILAMKQQLVFVWKNYFSSIKSITYTVIEILKERIYPQTKRHYLMWNTPPGGLSISPTFSHTLKSYPFYINTLSENPIDKFTAIIVAVTPVFKPSAPLFKLIQVINNCKFVDQILIVWLTDVGIPEKGKWPRTDVSLRVIHPPKKTLNTRFVSKSLITTDAVFTFDEDVTITVDQIDFAFSVWQNNPSRLIGFSTASHFYDIKITPPKWRVTKKFLNEFSIVDTSAAIFHKYYSHYYQMHAPKGTLELVENKKTCESLAMNFLISYITKQPPIRVTHSSQYSIGNTLKPRLDTMFTMEQYFEAQQDCFNALINLFDGLPLIHSQVAVNPVLYKDIVSITRKKYKQLE